MNQRAFDHILIIMLENQYRGYVMENEYMRNLAAQGIELTNSFGVMHPSQTNYITSIAGELCNVSDDDVPSPYLPQQTIVDLIEASPLNIDWRAYMDSYVPGWTPWKASDFTPIDAYPYVLKHNPFSSFSNILSSQERWQKIDNEAGFYRDLLRGEFPEYAWFTPNMWHDGHYLLGSKDNDLKGERAPVLVDQQAAWLKRFFADLDFPGPNSKLPPNTLVVVTYDEADFEAVYDPPDKDKYYYDGPNQIYTVLLGDMITPGKQHEGYNHYSLLKTVEKNFNLGSLGKNDHDANYFQFLWGRRFEWQTPLPTDIDNVQRLGAASYGNRMFVGSLDDNGSLSYRTFDGRRLSEAVTHSSSGITAFALAGSDSTLLLATVNEQQQLCVSHYHQDGGWQPETLTVDAKVVNVTLTAIPNHQAFMLVYQDIGGDLYSLKKDGDQWQSQADKLLIKAAAGFQLTALGSNLLLIARRADGSLVSMSYNTASFNVVNVEQSQYAGPYDDTTQNAWSPCAYSLNSFSSGPSLVTPHEPEPMVEGYRAQGNMTCAVLDGVIHLLHNNPDDSTLVEERFSISGVLTPKNPVSYNPKLEQSTSNGYGTMIEAGWSKQQSVATAMRPADGALACAELNGSLWLWYRPLNDSRIHCLCGNYQR